LTQAIPIPTIGIGSGPDCDGQILVTHDFVGHVSVVHAQVREEAVEKRRTDARRRDGMEGEL